MDENKCGDCKFFDFEEDWDCCHTWCTHPEYDEDGYVSWNHPACNRFEEED